MHIFSKIQLQIIKSQSKQAVRTFVHHLLVLPYLLFCPNRPLTNKCRKTKYVSITNPLFKKTTVSRVFLYSKWNCVKIKDLSSKQISKATRGKTGSDVIRPLVRSGRFHLNKRD